MDNTNKSYGFSSPQKKSGQNSFRGGNSFQKKNDSGDKRSRFKSSRSKPEKEKRENNFISSRKKEEINEKKRVEEMMSNKSNFPTLGESNKIIE